MQNSPLKEPNRIEDEESIDSPIKQTSKRKTSGARRRIESSSEEENGSPVKESPPKVKVPTSKGKKRKSSPSSLEKQTKKAKEEETEIKTEEKEVTTPEVNSKKRRSQKEKDALPKKSKSSGCKGKAKTSAAAKSETTEAAKAATTEKADDDSKKSPSPKKESPKKPSPVKKEKSSPSPKKAAEKTPKAKVNPFAAMMGKSPASTSAASASKDSKPFEEVIKKTNYDPIKDAIWKKDAKTPYLAFAKALQAVEATSGSDRKIEILSNYFKSVIALSPDDLLPSLYMVSNRIAPAWEGKELGIGETLLMKAIAQTTGRTVKEIKADVGKKGQYYKTAFFRLICYHRFWSY